MKTRPNQLIALSLPFPVFEESNNARWRAVLRTVEAELLTPVGIRSLSPFDKQYWGQCTGEATARDTAYHQGTVWPWLFGSYVTTYLRVFPPDPKNIAFVQQLYAPFKKRMTEAGIATVSEIYDGDPPNLSRGCISQAWSIAEILRTYSQVATQIFEQ